MKKIVTLTLNPCVDKSATVKILTPDDKLRCVSPLVEPGGGGINVSKAIKSLGHESTAIFPAGGPFGEFIVKELDKLEIKTCAVLVKGWTRENINIYEKKSRKQFRFIFPSEPLEKNDVETILEKLREISEMGFLVISGSLPEGIQDSFFKEIIKICKEKDAKIVWDSSLEGLKRALSFGSIFMIKPNEVELLSLIGMENEKHIDILKKAQKLLEMYDVKNVVISVGPQGAYVVSKEYQDHVFTPSVKKVSTVGAGDSMLGGMVLSLALGEDMRTAVIYGVACGTAAIMSAGSELCQKDDVDVLFERTMAMNTK